MKSTYFGGQHHQYLYLNEALSAQVAHRLEVNVPRIAVVRLSLEQARAYHAAADERDRPVFGIERVSQVEALTPDTAQASDPAEAAGIVVLDALVWNTDRKAEHVLAQQLEMGDLRLWAVDHGHTFSVRNALDASDLDPDRDLAPYDLLARRVTREHLAPFIDRAIGISHDEYVEMISAMPPEWVVEADAAERLGTALRDRAEALERVLHTRFGEA